MGVYPATCFRLSAAITLLCLAVPMQPAIAADSGRVLAVKHYQKIVPGKGDARSTTSTTTHWRHINGWEKSLTNKNPNLNHWSWMGMQEMEKSYVHLQPGQVVIRGGTPPQSHYVKPKHVAFSGKPSSHPPQYIGTSSPGGHYVKPIHVDPLSVQRPVAQKDTYIRFYAPKIEANLAAPKTAIQLAAPRTNAALTSKNTSIQLSAPKTAIKLAAPRTAIQLAAPRTGIQLAAPQTNAKLASKETHAALKPADDMAAGNSINGDSDTFSDPNAYAANPYGLARHVSSSSSSAAAHLQGKVLNRRFHQK